MSRIEQINEETVIRGLQEKIIELKKQPEFMWSGGRNNHEVTKDGLPDVKAGIANCQLDFDFWDDLRNPAKVGLYPVDIKQIWEFWANYNKKKADKAGRATIFQTPPAFDTAVEKYKRVIMISVMLPVNEDVFAKYNNHIRKNSIAPSDTYCKAVSETEKLLDRAVMRLSLDFIGKDRAVIAMNNKNAKRITEETTPLTHQGTSHGVCKGGNYSQKSIAVLTGLAQFGISRLVFRDEVLNDKIKRFIGPVLSLFIFDKELPVTDGTGGVLNLNTKWCKTLNMLTDFTNTDPEIMKYRFCTYQSGDKNSSCGLCINNCPSGALKNSSPACDGEYPEFIKKQKHRFKKGALQFDFAKCCDRRGQMSNLYEDWVCARCVSVCGAIGIKRKYAAENFREFKLKASL